MILLSLNGHTPAAIAELTGYHPRTVRRWIHRYHHNGTAGLADRPRAGRPRLGGPRLSQRIADGWTEPLGRGRWRARTHQPPETWGY